MHYRRKLYMNVTIIMGFFTYQKGCLFNVHNCSKFSYFNYSKLFCCKGVKWKLLLFFHPTTFWKCVELAICTPLNFFFNVQPSSYAIYFLNKKQKFFGLGFFGHKTPWLFFPCKVIFHQLWHTPTLLEKLKCESKSGNNGIRKSGVHSLACSTSG
jgi:hypothetical protein